MLMVTEYIPSSPCNIQIQQNKERLYKTPIKPVICYESETCTMTQAMENALNYPERKSNESVWSNTSKWTHIIRFDKKRLWLR